MCKTAQLQSGRIRPEWARKKAPANRGFSFGRSSRPFLAVVPVIHFLLRLVLRVAVALLQAAFELVLVAGDDVEIVVRQLTPLLLHLAFELLPVSFNTVPVHGCSFCFGNQPMQPAR